MKLIQERIAEEADAEQGETSAPKTSEEKADLVAAIAKQQELDKEGDE